MKKDEQIVIDAKEMLLEVWQYLNDNKHRVDYKRVITSSLRIKEKISEVIELEVFNKRYPGFIESLDCMIIVARKGLAEARARQKEKKLEAEAAALIKSH